MNLLYKNVFETCAWFKTGKDEFGAFGNMCGGFPLQVNDRTIHGSEILYQWFKFTHNTEIQQQLLQFTNPLKAKWFQKKYKNSIRPDWFEVNIDVMYFCVMFKYNSYKDYFDKLFEHANGKPIVEISSRDKFWGCVLEDDNAVGENRLGRVWMDIRDGKCKYTQQDRLERELLLFK